ncbi:MAG: two-component regulator propeller domain-containing protein [Bacteroidota bacterium]
MIRKLASISIWFCLCATQVWGGNGYTFRQLTEADGLCDDDVQALAQDSLGFLWIGTSSGLCRFDGHQFQEIPGAAELQLNNTFVSDLIADDQDGIWVGTFEFGLYHYNNRTGRWKHYTYDSKDPHSLADDRIIAAYMNREGMLYFGTHKRGICRYDREKDRFDNVLPSKFFPDMAPRRIDVVSDILQDPNNPNIMWLATLEGLFCYDEIADTMQVFFATPENTYNPELLTGIQNNIRNMYFDSGDSLWLGTWGGGFNTFNPQTGRYFIHLYEELSPASDIRNVVYNFIPAGKDAFWLGLKSREIGAARFNRKTHQFEYLRNRGKVQIPMARTFMEDRNGNLWVGSNRGLHVHFPQAAQFQKVQTPVAVADVRPHPDSDDLIFSGRFDRVFGVISRKDWSFDTLQYMPSDPLEKGRWIIRIHRHPDGRLILRDNRDLYEWDEAAREIRVVYRMKYEKKGRDQLSGFTSSMVDSAGIFWMGNKYEGLFRVDLETQTETHFGHDPDDPHSLVHDAWINDLEQDDRGRIWIGTEEGLGYFDMKDETFYNYHWFEGRSGRDDTRMKYIQSITFDNDGMVWVGSALKGLARIDPDLPRETPFETFTELDGLHSDEIRDLLTDHRGNLWAVTSEGLFEFNPKTKAVRNFGKAYNLGRLARASISKAGEIWVASYSGLFHFRPEDVQEPVFVPEVRLTSFSVFDQPYANDTALNYLDNIDLSWQQNFFSFEFAAPHFFSPEAIEYAYMLEGLESDWVVAGQRGYCSYTDVGGGSYTFKVKARVGKGPWGPTLALPIQITPPFWRTTWFYTLIVLLVLSILYGLYSFRLRQVRREAQLKSEFDLQLAEVEKKALKSQMNPHFLFNCLNSIKLMIVENQTTNAAHYLTRFSRLIRLILHHSGQSVITIAEEWQALEIYLEMEQLRFGERFQYELELAKDLNPHAFGIPPMLLQPFVENAIWHGLMHKKGKGNVWVRGHRIPNGLCFEILDDGIGRTAAQARKSKSAESDKSYGMDITQQRLKLNQHTSGKAFLLDVQDRKDAAGNVSGTVVRLTIPLLDPPPPTDSPL